MKEHGYTHGTLKWFRKSNFSLHMGKVIVTIRGKVSKVHVDDNIFVTRKTLSAEQEKVNYSHDLNSLKENLQ